MKRKISIILLLITTFILFVSCTGGSYTMTVGRLNGNSKHIEGQYNSFNGKYFSRVKLKDGDIVKYETSTTTEEGSINLLLLDRNKDILAKLEATGTIEINENQYYYFIAIGDHHKGSFKVEWSLE